MPLVGEFHTKYWERTSSGVHGTPAAPSRLGGYPLWQSASIAPSGLGMISAWWDTTKVQLRWWWRVVQLIRRLPGSGKAVLVRVLDALLASPEPYLSFTVGADLSHDAQSRALASKDYAADAEAVLDAVARALQHPAYGAAHRAVRQTATTIGFNSPQAWVKLSHTIRDHSAWAENTWRHLNACHLTQDAIAAQGSTLCNGDRHLLVQLAYAGFAKRRR